MPDRPRAGTVADDHRPDRHRGGQHAVDVELVGAHRLDRGDHPRQVLGLAAGHHRVDRDLLDRDLDEVGRHDGDDLVGCAAWCPPACAAPAPRSAASTGQSVGEAAVEQHLHLVLEVGQLESSRPQHAAAEPGTKRVDEIGVDAHRAAARVASTGRSSPRSAMPVIRCQSDRDQPTVRSTSSPSTTRISVGTVSMSWCQLIARSASWIGLTPGREGRVVLGVDGRAELRRAAARPSARLAVLA